MTKAKSKSESKSPARLYAEKVLPKVMAQYAARRMAGHLADNGVDKDDVLETATHPQKVVTLEMAGLMYLRTMFAPEFPFIEQVRDACIPPTLFSSDKWNDCDDESDEGDESRKQIRRTVGVGVALLHEMLGVYVHELSHKAAGEHYGAKGEIAVMVFPEIKMLGEEGYGMCLNVQGGRCRFVDTELTEEQQAVINVAGYMGEKLCATMKDDTPNAPARDTQFWADVFAAIVEAGDPEKALEDANNPVFHSGSFIDATNFYSNATTDESKRVAIDAAAAIITENWMTILAEASYRTLAHLSTLGEVLHVMSVGMKMAEAASVGKYGEVRIVNMGDIE